MSEPLPFDSALLLVGSFDDYKAGMTVMMVLFIAHEKGVNIIIKVMKNIKRYGGGWEFVMVCLNELICHFNLNGGITF